MSGSSGSVALGLCFILAVAFVCVSHAVCVSWARRLGIPVHFPFAGTPGYLARQLGKHPELEVPRGLRRLLFTSTLAFWLVLAAGVFLLPAL